MKMQSDFHQYKGVIEDIGYGSRIGEGIPATTTYRVRLEPEPYAPAPSTDGEGVKDGAEEPAK